MQLWSFDLPRAKAGQRLSRGAFYPDAQIEQLQVSNHSI